MLDDKDEFYAPPKWTELLRHFIEEGRNKRPAITIPGDIIDIDRSGSMTAEQIYEFLGR
jgi:hypothetical protein